MNDQFGTPNHKVRAGVGFGIAVLATFLSVASYEAAQPGSRYVIWWGGVLWGLWYGGKHLFFLLKEQQEKQMLRKSVFRMLDGSDEESHKLRVAIAFAQMAVLVAAADKSIDESEIDAICAFYRRHGAGEDFMELLRSILLKLAIAPEVDTAVAVLRREVQENVDVAELLALALLEVGLADGHIDESEIHVIVGILVKLGFGVEDATNLLASFFEKDGEEDERKAALRALGLDEEATLEEVKVAYRELAQKYHPDKVSHLGPEFQDIAERKMKEINAAYEFLTA